MKTLREFIEGEKVKQTASQRNSTELDEILERLENEDFSLTEYDDIVTRHLIERVTVEGKKRISIRFKGGFVVQKEL